MPRLNPFRGGGDLKTRINNYKEKLTNDELNMEKVATGAGVLAVLGTTALLIYKGLKGRGTGTEGQKLAATLVDIIKDPPRRVAERAVKTATGKSPSRARETEHVRVATQKLEGLKNMLDRRVILPEKVTPENSTKYLRLKELAANRERGLATVEGATKHLSRLSRHADWEPVKAKSVTPENSTRYFEQLIPTRVKAENIQTAEETTKYLSKLSRKAKWEAKYLERIAKNASPENMTKNGIILPQARVAQTKKYISIDTPAPKSPSRAAEAEHVKNATKKLENIAKNTPKKEGVNDRLARLAENTAEQNKGKILLSA